MSYIMWGTVAAGVVFCVVYFLIMSNNTRKAIAENATRLSTELVSSYPEYRRQVERISVYKDKITVSPRSADAESREYVLKDYGFSDIDETMLSAIANYIQDALKDGEWKRELDRSTENGVTVLNAVSVVNMTRLSYTDKLKNAELEENNNK